MPQAGDNGKLAIKNQLSLSKILLITAGWWDGTSSAPQLMEVSGGEIWGHTESFELALPPF